MTTQFTQFLRTVQWSEIPADAQSFARLWLLDLIGVAAGGRQTELSRIIHNHVADHFGAGGSKAARMVFDGRPVSPAGAALAGGMTIDALDGHDGHKLTKGHAGCGVLPALLAFADAEGINDGEEFLTCLILGYEIGTRAGIALHRTAPDYHSSGAWVAIAVAAIGARILKLTPDQTRHAIGIAEYHGPRSQMMRCIDHPTMLKDGSGWGAMAGVSAAYLAKTGFTGAPAITVEADEVQDIWGDLGDHWCVADQYFKHYPICRWAQPPVQAVLDLRAEHGVTPEDVDKIEIITFHESLRLAVRDPQTTEQAQYSTGFPAAIAMVHGEVGPEHVMESAFENAEVQRLAANMVITESDAYNEAFPARRVARVTLHLTDGRRVTSQDTEALGDPPHPVTADEVSAKFHRYAAPVLGEERVHHMEQIVHQMGQGATVRSLTDQLFVGLDQPEVKAAKTSMDTPMPTKSF